MVSRTARELYDERCQDKLHDEVRQALLDSREIEFQETNTGGRPSKQYRLLPTFCADARKNPSVKTARTKALLNNTYPFYLFALFVYAHLICPHAYRPVRNKRKKSKGMAPSRRETLPTARERVAP